MECGDRGGGGGVFEDIFTVAYFWQKFRSMSRQSAVCITETLVSSWIFNKSEAERGQSASAESAHKGVN